MALNSNQIIRDVCLCFLTDWDNMIKTKEDITVSMVNNFIGRYEGLLRNYCFFEGIRVKEGDAKFDQTKEGMLGILALNVRKSEAIGFCFNKPFFFIKIVICNNKRQIPLDVRQFDPNGIPNPILMTSVFFSVPDIQCFRLSSVSLIHSICSLRSTSLSGNTSFMCHTLQHQFRSCP